MLSSMAMAPEPSPAWEGKLKLQFAEEPLLVFTCV